MAGTFAKHLLSLSNPHCEKTAGLTAPSVVRGAVAEAFSNREQRATILSKPTSEEGGAALMAGSRATVGIKAKHRLMRRGRLQWQSGSSGKLNACNKLNVKLDKRNGRNRSGAWKGSSGNPSALNRRNDRRGRWSGRSRSSGNPISSAHKRSTRRRNFTGHRRSGKCRGKVVAVVATADKAKESGTLRPKNSRRSSSSSAAKVHESVRCPRGYPAARAAFF